MPWVLGAAAASALIAALSLFFGALYGSADDMPLQKALMGFEGGYIVAFAADR